jgi:hypothetical protein
VALDQRLELSDEIAVPAEYEIGLDSIFETDEAKLLEPRFVEPRERLRKLGQRWAPPQCERSTKALRRGLRPSGSERLTPAGKQLLEAMEVELGASELEGVSGRARHHVRCRQALSQLGDVDLHHLARRLGGSLAPEIVDQTGDRDDATRVEQEARQQRSLLASAELQRLTVSEHLERAENPELQPRVYRRSIAGPLPASDPRASKS